MPAKAVCDHEQCSLNTSITSYNMSCSRRRYTDSRHPTTELPDVRDGAPAPDFPSVREPPVRSKSKSKEVLEENTEPGVGEADEQVIIPFPVSIILHPVSEEESQHR